MSDPTPESEAPRSGPFAGFRLEIDPDKVEEAIRSVRARIEDSVVAGRYTKVRLSYRGQRLGPDIPLGVFLAAEGAAFWLLSPIAALLANLGAKAILDVEFIHEADELVQEGLAAYLDGELEEAESKYRAALDKRPDDPAALYNLGTLLRVTDRAEQAIKVLRQAAMGPEGHPDVRRAAEALERLTDPKRRL